MALRSVSTSDLRRELARREAGASRLQARREKLARELAALDAELSGLGASAPRAGRKPGRPAGRRAGRSRNGGLTLLGAILKGVRPGATVSPAEAAIAARKAGYKSTSQHFGMMVANTLAKSSEFKKLGRGQYQLTSGASTPAKRGRPPGPAKGKGRKAKPGKSGMGRKVRKIKARKVHVGKGKTPKSKSGPSPAVKAATAAAAAAGAAAAAAG